MTTANDYDRAFVRAQELLGEQFPDPGKKTYSELLLSHYSKFPQSYSQEECEAYWHEFLNLLKNHPHLLDSDHPNLLESIKLLEFAAGSGHARAQDALLTIREEARHWTPNYSIHGFRFGDPLTKVGLKLAEWGVPAYQEALAMERWTGCPADALEEFKEGSRFGAYATGVHSGVEWFLKTRPLDDRDNWEVDSLHRLKCILKLVEHQLSEFHATMIAAVEGDSDAQYTLGVWFFEGKHFEPDHDAGLKWLQKASMSGSSMAAQKAKELRQLSDTIREFRSKAEAGDSEAQFQMGFVCLYGQGLPKDADAAKDWWQKASAQGHKRAQNVLQNLMGE